MILGPVFGVDGRRGTSAKALKASKGAGARISSDYLATPPVPKFASSGYGISEPKLAKKKLQCGALLVKLAGYILLSVALSYK